MVTSRPPRRVQDNGTPPSLVSAPQAPSPGLFRRAADAGAGWVDNAFMLVIAVAFVYGAVTGNLM